MSLVVEVTWQVRYFRAGIEAPESRVMAGVEHNLKYNAVACFGGVDQDISGRACRFSPIFLRISPRKG